MKNENQKNIPKSIRILIMSLLVLVCLLSSCLLVLFILVNAGKSSLVQKNAETSPKLESEELTPELQEQLNTLKTLQWEDDWVAIDDKVYSYNKNLLNFLVLGIDKPGNLSKENDYGNWDAGQADVIFLVSLDTEKKNMHIVGIPRNSMVNINIYDENNRCINTIYNQICLQYGYGGGGENSLVLMKDAVSELFHGLPISGVCAVSYGAVTTINDMVGGVDVEVLEDLHTKNPELIKGRDIHLSGKLALDYIRERDSINVGAPTKRLERQKQYVTALMKQVIMKLKANPLIVKNMYDSVIPYMNTDITFDETTYLASLLPEYHFEGDGIYLLQGEDKATPYVEEDGKEGFFDDYYLYDESIKETMVKVFYQEVVVNR